MILFFYILVFWGPYFEHVLEAWEKRSHPNMLFLFYEDMIRVGRPSFPQYSQLQKVFEIHNSHNTPTVVSEVPTYLSYLKNCKSS